MTKKTELLTLILCPTIIDKISNRTNVEKKTLKELTRAIKNENIEDAVQIFMIINGKVTEEEIQRVLNLRNVEVLENILHVAPEIIEERDEIADRLLEEGYRISSQTAISRIIANPELANHLSPSYLGQLLLKNIGLAGKINDEIVTPALETLKASEVSSLLIKKPSLSTLLSEDLLIKATQQLPVKKNEVIRGILLCELPSSLLKRVIYENLEKLDQDAIEIGVEGKKIIDYEMAQDIINDLSLDPLIALLHKYSSIKISIEKLAQVLRESPELSPKLSLERLEEVLSHLNPKDCLGILEEVNGTKYLLVLRYIMRNKTRLLQGEHFKKAIRLGLASSEITKNMIEKMDESALSVVLTAFPRLSLNLNIKELSLPLIKQIIKSLEREALFQNLTSFPLKAADVLYEKLSEEKSRFWEEMKTISKDKADHIATIIAYAPEKMRNLFLDTYGSQLLEQTDELAPLVQLIRGNNIKKEIPKGKLPGNLLLNLYMEGKPINPTTIWGKISKRPKVLEKVAKQSPKIVVENINQIPLGNFISVFDTLEEEYQLEAFQKMPAENIIKVMTLKEYYPENLRAWEKIIDSYPRLGLIPQAPPNIRVQAALRLDSKEMLEDILKMEGIQAVEDKAFAVLREGKEKRVKTRLKKFLTAEESVVAGALIFLLYQLLNEEISADELIEVLRKGENIPEKKVLIQFLKRGGVLGFANGLAQIGFHQHIPKTDILKAFGQPKLFNGKIGEQKVTSNKVSSILLEHVKLIKKEKILGQSFKAIELTKKERKLPIEKEEYNTRKEKKLIGNIIQELIAKENFRLPIFLIMSYNDEVLPEFDITGKLGEFNNALTKLEDEGIPEVQEAVEKLKAKIRERKKAKEAREKKRKPSKLKKKVDQLLDDLEEPFDESDQEE